MARGKYSPTVTAAYSASRQWWESYALTGQPNNGRAYVPFDPEGYDSYGYNEQGYDRAGNHENDYLANTDGDSNFAYDQALRDWRFDGIKPITGVATCAPAVTPEAIHDVLTHIVSKSHTELLVLTQDELKARWYFRIDPKASPAWNLYKFSDALEHYKRDCRKWEEHHHGSCCVVERVRDTYLMPRINEFLRQMGDSLS